MSGAIYDIIYPLTITADRYGGAYSGGNFIAWNLEPSEVPKEPFEDDVGCAMFWDSDKAVLCGKGDTPEEAVANLYVLLGGDGK